MKFTKCHYATLALAATLMGASGSVSAQWLRSDVGPVIKVAATRALPASWQASGAWGDAYWNGKKSGMAMYCAPKSLDCTYNLGRTVTTTYSTMNGTEVGKGYGVDLGVIGLGLTYQYIDTAVETFEQSVSKTDTFTNGITVQGGYYIIPVKIVDRRLSGGAFQTAWFRTPTNVAPPKGQAYYFYENDKFGSWMSNMANAKSAHYTSFLVTKTL